MPAPRICNYPPEALVAINRLVDAGSAGYRNFIVSLCQQKKWDPEHAKGWPSIRQVDAYIEFYLDKKRERSMTTSATSKRSIDGLQKILDDLQDGKVVNDKDILRAKASLMGKLKVWIEMLEESNIANPDLDSVDLIRKLTMNSSEILDAISKIYNPAAAQTQINFNFSPQGLVKEMFEVVRTAIRKNYPSISFDLERDIIEELNIYSKKLPGADGKTIDTTASDGGAQ